MTDVQDVRQNVKFLEDQKDQFLIECTGYRQSIAELKDHISRYGMNAVLQRDTRRLTSQFMIFVSELKLRTRNFLNSGNRKIRLQRLLISLLEVQITGMQADDMSSAIISLRFLMRAKQTIGIN